MESAIKYIMFGIAANGIMFFGMSYLFGLTGTTSLPDLLPKLQPVHPFAAGHRRPGDDLLRALLQARDLPLPFLDAGCLPGRLQRNRRPDRLAAQNRRRGRPGPLRFPRHARQHTPWRCC